MNYNNFPLHSSKSFWIMIVLIVAFAVAALFLTNRCQKKKSEASDRVPQSIHVFDKGAVVVWRDTVEISGDTSSIVVELVRRYDSLKNQTK